MSGINLCSFLIFFLYFHLCHGYYVNSDEEIKFSSAEECLRPCKKGENRKFCHYEFNLEAYPALNKACRICKPDINQGLLNKPTCECILVDGIERTVFSVNRMLPGPHIQVCKNDYVIVDVKNHIPGTMTTIHWHGILQRGYQYYDGVPFVTQCPVNEDQTFRYQFDLNESGTFFWHSHAGVQRLDGVYGPLIVREDPDDDAHSILYDIDDPTHVILISDWLHRLSLEKFPGLANDPGQSATNVLINGRGVFKWDNGTVTNVERAKFMVEKGKRYRFRLINAFTTNCFTEFSIENHELLIIAQDGTNVEPISVNTITTGAGERVDFIINATGDVKSYWIQVRALGLCRMNKVQQLAILEYQGQLHRNMSDEPEYQNPLPRGLVYNPANATCRGILNDTICPSDFKSLDEIDSDLLKVKPDIRYVMPFSFHFFNTEGACNYFYSSNTSDFMRFIVPRPEFTVMGSMDDVVFKSPPAPPLTQSEGYADSCDGKNSPICEKFKEPTPCVCTNIKLIPLDSVVEVILYDQAPLVQLPHPFHLHGHQFQLFDIGRFVDKRVVSREDMQIIIDEHDERLSNGFYDLRQPPKDTVLVAQSGWVIFRFKANNPGVWMLHCHLDFHHAVGMAVMFKVGEAEDLPPIPPNFPRCGDFKPTVDYHEKSQHFH